MMSAFLISLAVVALSEMGDKTQLLALLLSTRFRKPIPHSIGDFFSHTCQSWCFSHIGSMDHHGIESNCTAMDCFIRIYWDGDMDAYS